MLTHLRCTLTGETFPADRPQNLSPAGRPLFAEYDLSPRTLDRAALRDRENTLWRYREVLPACTPLTLGEGMTPLHHAPRLGARWYVKDESVNPTGSFKARGMATAIAMARHFGIREVAVPSAGNAAGAMAAYAAAAGIEAFVFMPRDTPKAFIVECETLGAHVQLIDGLITDCGAEIARRKEAEGWFDVSTLKEPYRVEGKKTMGYEIAEQLEWRLPDVVIYPAGGGTGLVGMGKAFDEMERLGWIDGHRPRMVAVQAAGCAPIATAFANGERFATEFLNAHTRASGLRVPKAVGDFIMLDLIRATGGTALTVTDDEMIAATRDLGRATGIFAAPEGGSVLAAARRLADEGWIRPHEVVVLFNTGSGLKYLGAFE